MKTPNLEVHDFIFFCVNRRGKEWPALYDEMCWVAGRRLFKGMGYAELRELGLSLSLSHIEDIAEIVDSITA